jgi:predicted DNA-binding protein
MPLTKKYDETPLQVLTDKATRDRVRRLARTTGRSQAQVMRDILAVGIPMMEDAWGLREEGEDGVGEQ